MYKENDRLFCLVFIGLPGSGKSFLAKKLAERLSLKYLGTDEIRIEMGLRGQYQLQEKSLVYSKMLEKAKTYLRKNESVILDGTFFLKKLRAPFIKLAKSIPCRQYWIMVEAEKPLISERLAIPRPYSDADLAVHELLSDKFESFEGELLKVKSTNENLEECIGLVLNFIGNKDEK